MVCARLIQRLDDGHSACNKLEGMPKEFCVDYEIASLQDASQSQRALAMTLPGYGKNACRLRQTYSDQSTYFQKIPQDGDDRTQEDTRYKKHEVMARSSDLAWMELVQ